MKLKDKIKNYIRSFLKYMALSPAGIVLLTWSNNTEADLRGYNIYYSTTLGNYTTQNDVGNVTQHRIDNLEDGKTYHFVITAYDAAGNESDFSKPTSVFIEPGEDKQPQQVNLGSYNFPNPFTPRDENTRIRYQLSNPSEVTIEIYDIGNKLVRRLANNITKLAGAHSEDVWDGRNESGSSVANGAYLCKIQTQEFTNFIRIAVVN